MDTVAVGSSGRALAPATVDAAATQAAAADGAARARPGAAAKAKAASKSAPKGAAKGAGAKTAASSRTKVVPKGKGAIEQPKSGYAPARAAKAAKAGGELAFLDDPRWSAEEKLVMLLGLQKKKLNAEIEELLKKQKEAAAQPKKSGGGSTKLFDVAKVVVPALGLTDQMLGGKLDDLLKQVSGPMLAAAATAAGAPALAPLAMSLGPKLADVILSAEIPGTKASGEGAAAGPTKGGGSAGKLDEQAMLEIQLLQRRVEEWTALVSNLLQSLHQTKMSVIQNLR